MEGTLTFSQGSGHHSCSGQLHKCGGTVRPDPQLPMPGGLLASDRLLTAG